MKKQISDKALLVGFFILWLKRCVVPTSLYDVLLVELVYLIVRIACGDKITLVLVTLANIHYGLRRMMVHLCTLLKTSPRNDIANGLDVMHFSPLMHTPSAGPTDVLLTIIGVELMDSLVHPSDSKFFDKLDELHNL